MQSGTRADSCGSCRQRPYTPTCCGDGEHSMSSTHIFLRRHGCAIRRCRVHENLGVMRSTVKASLSYCAPAQRGAAHVFANHASQARKWKLQFNTGWTKFPWFELASSSFVTRRGTSEGNDCGHVYGDQAWRDALGVPNQLNAQLGLSRIVGSNSFIKHAVRRTVGPRVCDFILARSSRLQNLPAT